jgi:hypothetical protein
VELSDPQVAAVESCDLFVYGASPAGIGAAVAASLAVRDGTAPHGVSVKELQHLLEQAGQIIHPPVR